MLIRHSYDSRFVQLLQKLKEEYGQKIFDLSGIGENDLDINSYSRNFFTNDNLALADKTVDGNANISDKSVLSWENELKKPIMKLNSMYMLWKSAEKKHGIKRANKFIESELRGAIRIHDFHYWTKPYCWATSLDVLVQNGMPWYEKIKISCVKHFDSLINVSLQYLCSLSNSIAGAVAMPDFFIYCEYFIRKDYGENWFENPQIVEHINQQFQSWIYSVNFNWRSNQSPFTNLTVFDKKWLHALFGTHINPDCKKTDLDNVIRIQKLFVNQMIKDLKDNPFTFPVMTAALLFNNETHDFDDQEFLDFVCDINSGTGLFNFYIDDKTASLASCCRLRNSIEEANRQHVTSFGSSGLNIGSHRVVTVNLPQVAYQSESWEDFIKLLEYRINLSQEILDINRETLTELIENGRLPLYTHKCIDLDKQFSTLGFIGLNEALEIMGYDIITLKGTNKAKEILTLMNDMNDKRSKEDGKLRNIEQIPGESAAYTFALKDQVLFENTSLKYPIYSNQYIPLSKSVDIQQRIRQQGQYDKTVGGGSILHLNIQEKVSKEQIKKLVSHCAKMGVVYFAINYNFCQCNTCDKVYIGQFNISPCHQASVKKYTRIVGFLSETDHWSQQRKFEYSNRQFYNSDVF